MKTRLISVVLCVLALSACSIFSGGSNDGEKRVVDEEEITVRQVYITKERKQCQDDSGRPLDDTESELEAEAITVYDSQCGIITGILAPTMCGRTTLHINIHGIDERKIPEAEDLGYKPVSSFEDDIDYTTISCDDE